MPRATLVPRKDGRYRCRYKGKEFYGNSPTEAFKKREHYIDLLKRGLRAESEGITVREYSDMWLPTHKQGIKRQTYNAYKGYLGKMNAVIGDSPIMRIVPSDIARVYNTILGMSASTAQKLKLTVNAMFKSAVADGCIRANPCENISPPKAKSGTHRAITDEELSLILETPHRLRLAVLTMRYAGLRRGEVLALDIDKDIDFQNDIIHVRRAVSFDGNKRVIGQPKTENGIRDVPLFSRLRAELINKHGLIVGKEMTQCAFARAWESYVNAVERKMNGCQKRWYGKRKQDHDLPEWKSFTVRPHDLRHSFAQMLCDANVEIDLAISWMGHSDERMIRRIYDHVSDYRKQKATQDVESMLKEREV